MFVTLIPVLYLCFLGVSESGLYKGMVGLLVFIYSYAFINLFRKLKQLKKEIF